MSVPLTVAATEVAGVSSFVQPTKLMAKRSDNIKPVMSLTSFIKITFPGNPLVIVCANLGTKADSYLFSHNLRFFGEPNQRSHQKSLCPCRLIVLE
jgi:hypothetical protein